jgi:hypothetical protein
MENKKGWNINKAAAVSPAIDAVTKDAQITGAGDKPRNNIFPIKQVKIKFDDFMDRLESGQYIMVDPSEITAADFFLPGEVFFIIDTAVNRTNMDVKDMKDTQRPPVYGLDCGDYIVLCYVARDKKGKVIFIQSELYQIYNETYNDIEVIKHDCNNATEIYIDTVSKRDIINGKYIIAGRVLNSCYIKDIPPAGIEKIIAYCKSIKNSL